MPAQRPLVSLATAAVLIAGCAAPGAATQPEPSLPATSAAPVPTPSSASASPTTAPSTSAPSASRPATTSQTASASPKPSPANWRTGPTVKGIDVSRYQRSVPWRSLVAGGYRFVFVKATEGTSHRSPTFTAQRSAARRAGMLQGSYHYARPAASTGAAQARFFVANGGRWTPDGRTLPGVLDLEKNTAGDACYGKTPRAMAAWVKDFSDTYRDLTGRRPIIYVKAEIWRRCVGDDPSFGRTNPLWLYDHEGRVGPLPNGWERPTFWQRGVVANLDRNVFYGTWDELKEFARRP